CERRQVAAPPWCWSSSTPASRWRWPTGPSCCVGAAAPSREPATSCGAASTRSNGTTWRGRSAPAGTRSPIPMPLGEVMARAAAAYGERVAVVDGDRRVSFRELDERANRFGNALLVRGLVPGDRVALLLGNRLEWFDATYG